MGTKTAALILDVDGVISPVHGHTAWGDDVVAGHLFGPVLVSPAMCARIEQLALHPHLTCWWLTSWTADMREAMDPFPGRTWPDIEDLDQANAHTQPGWWKWNALWAWLETHPMITRLAWCDDHLTDGHLVHVQPRPTPHPAFPSAGPEASAQPHGRDAIAADLLVRGISATLVAPQGHVGLTPEDLDRLELVFAERGPGQVSGRDQC